MGCPPALRHVQLEQSWRRAEEGAGLRQIARVLNCSTTAVNRKYPSWISGR